MKTATKVLGQLAGQLALLCGGHLTPYQQAAAQARYLDLANLLLNNPANSFEHKAGLNEARAWVRDLAAKLAQVGV